VAEKPTTNSVDKTQEPTIDIEIDIQELEVEGAETLLFLQQEAETQATTTIPATPSQQPKATMASVLQENEFLKLELEAYRQELAREKEAYEKELTSYTLSRITTLSEQTTESVCKEYMCCQCGDIYHQAGYKVIQVPVPGAVPIPSPFEVKKEPAATQEPTGSTKLKTEPAATQEPAGPSKLKTEPVATQEPAGPSRLKTEPYIVAREVPTIVNKVVQTMPMEEFAPPNQINLSTSKEQSTQTLPNPTTSNAETQTQLWDEHAKIQKWKKEYAET
jgi:regulator of replication initiation timing